MYTYLLLSTHICDVFINTSVYLFLWIKMKLKVKCVIILLAIFVCASYILYPCVKSQGKINRIQRIKSVESYCLQDFQDKNESTFYSHISVLNRIQNCHQYFDVFPTTAYHKVCIIWILILILENTNQKFFSYFTENFAWWW